MFKTFVFLLFLLPAAFGFSPRYETAYCDCLQVSDLQKTGQTSSAVSFSRGSTDATQYKIWYTRQEDHYTSSFFYTGNAFYTFSNLRSGTYNFFFVAICGEEESGFVGVEDVVLE